MIVELEEKLWLAGSGETFDEATWRRVISALLDEFEVFLGEPFVRDPEVNIYVDGSAFQNWLWSVPRESRALLVEWSAVLYGNRFGDSDWHHAFAVGIDLFFFHDSKRLHSHDKKHFLQFVFDGQELGDARWRSLGWVEDEWGEWEGCVPSPES